MPQQFNSCVSGGGKVITKKMSGGRYLHICYPKGGGKPIAGEVKTGQKAVVKKTTVKKGNKRITKIALFKKKK